MQLTTNVYFTHENGMVPFSIPLNARTARQPAVVNRKNSTFKFSVSCGIFQDDGGVKGIIPRLLMKTRVLQLTYSQLGRGANHLTTIAKVQVQGSGRSPW